MYDTPHSSPGGARPASDAARGPYPAGDRGPEPDAGTAGSSAGARAIVSALLRSCSRDTARVRADAHLAVTELVSNALRHGGGMTGFRVSLAPDATLLRIEVEDANDQVPVSPSQPDLDFRRLGGRGWAIVQRLAQTCTIHPVPTGGKRIEITLPV